MTANNAVKQKCDSQMGRYYFGSSSDKEIASAPDLQESVIKDSAVTSVFPIDLSSKNTPGEHCSGLIFIVLSRFRSFCILFIFKYTCNLR